MKKALSSLLAMLALVSVASLPQLALAKDVVVQVKQVPKRKSVALSESMGRSIGKAYDLFEKAKYQDALNIVQDLSPRSDYDKAYVKRFIGTIYYYQDKWDKSLQYLKEAADMNALNQTEQESVLRQVGQMLQQKEKWRESLTYLNKWMDFSGKASADVYTLMAQAYYQLKELNKVVEYADKAIAMYKEPNKNPYILKLGAFYERKQYAQMVPVLKTLVHLDPKEKQWWMQLSQSYMLLNQTDNALATYALAYKQGFLKKENEGKVLAQLYANQDIPYKSAIIQEKFIKAGIIPADEKAYSTLANTWRNAKELDKAIAYYGKAAKLSDNGKDYLKQGNLLIEKEDFDRAIEAFNEAIKAGKLPEPGQVHLSLAQAYFFKHKYLPAIQQLRLAAKFKETAKTAKSWEGYVRDEAKRKNVDL
ncbi:tetratricopeptide repeat protein [Gallaecimonas sp. GXIMD1310]|uniref:tetratricopeptide repeat protein n=1 Tax=Gallaecimonas sp. GXIMD1310 TaxID=3131926 RepID=UPI003254DB9D